MKMKLITHTPLKMTAEAGWFFSAGRRYSTARPAAHSARIFGVPANRP